MKAIPMRETREPAVLAETERPAPDRSKRQGPHDPLADRVDAHHRLEAGVMTGGRVLIPPAADL
jgi:hypothetical protein